MDKQEFSTIQGTFSSCGSINTVDQLQSALTRIPLYGSSDIIAETCRDAGLQIKNGSFASKLTIGEFARVAAALDRKLLGGVSAVASIEDARELLEALGLSVEHFDEQPSDAAPTPFADTTNDETGAMATHSSAPRSASTSLTRATSFRHELLPPAVAAPASPIERGRSVVGLGQQQPPQQPPQQQAQPPSPSLGALLPPAAGASAAWLAPKPSQKGRGPRGCIYLHDNPPSQRELHEHFSRLVERICAGAHSESSVACDSRPRPRTMGDLLRLPQLTEAELATVANTSAQHVHDACRAEPSWCAEFKRAASPEARKPTAEEQLAAAIHSDNLRSNQCNAIVAQTYRRAGDIGLSTGSCMKLIYRGAVEKASRKEAEMIEKKKKKLRDKFVL